MSIKAGPKFSGIPQDVLYRVRLFPPKGGEPISVHSRDSMAAAIAKGLAALPVKA